ncbi:MAG: hypothetical protein DI537_20295 [Stutzerimonas stutzeri]|nr:MAG: hypothetical protein DI537_20295 [Stutzerimonas stutzeri]
MKKVVIINGKPRSGKDTAVGFMQGVLKESCISSASFSSIEPVRTLLANAGIDVTAKTPADRALLAEIGFSLEKHSAYRSRATVEFTLEFFRLLAHKSGVVFLHIREPEMIERVTRLIEEKGFDTITILVESNRAEKVISNAADMNVGDIDYTAILSNHGSLELLQANCCCILHALNLLPIADNSTLL